MTPSPTTYFLYVGTRTTSDRKGIYLCSYDAKSGDLQSLGLAVETLNPTFLAVDQGERTLYSVNEVSEYKGVLSGAITAFAINPATGRLSAINQIASRGAEPCYLSLDKTAKYALVANYSGGSVGVFPLLSDGGLAGATAFIQHAGVGKNPERQEGAHPHWIETTPTTVLLSLPILGSTKFSSTASTPAEELSCPIRCPRQNWRPEPGHVTSHFIGTISFST